MVLLTLATGAGFPAPAQAGGLDRLIYSIKAAFDPTGAEFEKLVDEGEFTKALALFNEKFGTYFDKKFGQGKTALTPQLQTLGLWLLDKEYAPRIADVSQRLQGVPPLTTNIDGAWARTGQAIKDGEKLLEELGSNNLLFTTRMGDTPLVQLKIQLNEAHAVVERDRATAFANTLDAVFLTGVFDPTWPVNGFKASDYQNAEVLQQRIRDEYPTIAPAAREQWIKRLENVASPTTLYQTAGLDRLKKSLVALGPKPWSLDKLDAIKNIAKEFGKDSGLDNAVKIGYADLTTDLSRYGKAFDFSPIFEKDYGVTLQDAREDFLGKKALTGYDYIFVTKLSSTKLPRESTSQREVPSTTQTGTREEPNPVWAVAKREYDDAVYQMEEQAARMAQTKPPTCNDGFLACALMDSARGFVHTMIVGDPVGKARKTLADTPKTLSIPVYSDYRYQLEDIKASKVIAVDCYVIDVKKRRIYTNYFETGQDKTFTLPHNVSNNDPAAATINAQYQREEDITAWQKKPTPVPLSDVFHLRDINPAKGRPWVGTEAFLKSLEF